MSSFQKILVGVDLHDAGRLVAEPLAEPAERAVEQAIQFAAKHGAELTFATVLELPQQSPRPVAADPSDLIERTRQAAEAALDKLVERATKAGLTATSRVLVGRPWMQLLQLVLAEQSDLLFVGTRHRGRTARIVFGSTAMKLVRKCPCPVWVTTADAPRETRTVLVASDLGEVSEDALRLAVDLGQVLDVKIHVLHAVEYPFAGPMSITGLPEEEVEEYRTNVRTEAETILNEQLSQSDYRTLPHGAQVHLVDLPAETAILDFIREHQVDLLVMGTLGRGGVPGLLIGNTAERILPELACSLLAIKPRDFECPVAPAS